MDSIYGIIIKHPKKENYGFPLKLEEIDQIMTSNTKEELLSKIKDNNIIPYLNEESDFVVGIINDKKWIERKIIPTITDSFILYYPFEKEFLNNSLEAASYLYNQLVYLVDKKYVSEGLKKAILSLKHSPLEFIDNYHNLEYFEKRLIRYTYAKGFNLKKDNYMLQRK